MSKYRKKPVVIEAFQWTGDRLQDEDPMWIVNAITAGTVKFNNINTPDVTMQIETLEGIMTAQCGDWICRGTRGEIYPCKNDAFRDSHELELGEMK